MRLRNLLIRTCLILVGFIHLPALQVLAGESRSASVTAVGSIGVTESEMDRSVAFYSDVLTFKIISDVDVDGPEYDQL